MSRERRENKLRTLIQMVDMCLLILGVVEHSFNIYNTHNVCVIQILHLFSSEGVAVLTRAVTWLLETQTCLNYYQYLSTFKDA